MNMMNKHDTDSRAKAYTAVYGWLSFTGFRFSCVCCAVQAFGELSLICRHSEHQVYLFVRCTLISNGVRWKLSWVIEGESAETRDAIDHQPVAVVQLEPITRGTYNSRYRFIRTNTCVNRRHMPPLCVNWYGPHRITATKFETYSVDEWMHTSDAGW